MRDTLKCQSNHEIGRAVRWRLSRLDPIGKTTFVRGIASEEKSHGSAAVLADVRLIRSRKASQHAAAGIACARIFTDYDANWSPQGGLPRAGFTNGRLGMSLGVKHLEYPTVALAHSTHLRHVMV